MTRDPEISQVKNDFNIAKELFEDIRDRIEEEINR